MSNETDAFTETGGGRSASFTVEDKWVTGTIVEVTQKQETSFGTKEPVFWKDGSPKMQQVVIIQTDDRDDEDDDGKRAIWCKWGQVKAIGDAIKAAGHKGAMVGGTLAVRWHGSEDTGKGNPLKKWEARFKAPEQTSAFTEGEPPESDDSEPF